MPARRSPAAAAPAKVTVTALRARKRGGPKIVALTAYDVTFARLADAAGVDVILVGDSLGMVVQGRRDTLGVTVDEMAYHARAVARGVRRAHVVVDMPFMSYQGGLDDGVRAAGRLVKQGRAEAVKIEGGVEIAPLVRRLVAAGIPVMGHVGMTPQSVHALGGFRVQGRRAADARRIVAAARAVAAAGAYAIVVEGVPARLGVAITRAVPVPTIGIGAGAACDGQVLVMHDLLGLDPRWAPRFVRRYAQLGRAAARAFARYAADVRAGRFPGSGEVYD